MKKINSPFTEAFRDNHSKTLAGWIAKPELAERIFKLMD